MKSLFNLNNKGYFSSINKKIIYRVYIMIRNEFKKKLGRKCKVSLLEQIVITLFKLRYNLPDRILEDLFKIDHVTISRIILRISSYLSQLKVNINNLGKELYYCVDSTVLRIGKGKNKETYSGLNELRVEIPIKRNEIKYKENKDLSKSNNKSLSGKRIKIEHVFAYIKSYRIMQRLNYYSKQRIEILFNSIVNIYNLQQLFKI